MSGETALVLIISVIVLAAGIVSSVINRVVRLGYVLVVTVIIGSIGFLWLPKKIEQCISGETTPTEVINQTTEDYEHSGIPEAITMGENAAKQIIEKLWDDVREWMQVN